MTFEKIPTVDEWWPKLPERVRETIARDPHGSLSAHAVVAITRVRGYGPAGGSVGGSDPDFRLNYADASWIAEHGNETVGGKS